MKSYEITYISLENLGAQKDGDPVNKLISSMDGKILNTVSLGEKQFAYRIKKENKGYYTTVVFEIAPEKILELNKKLAQNNDVLRFLIIIHKENPVPRPKTIKEVEKSETLPELVKSEEITAKEVKEPKAKVAPKKDSKVKTKISKDLEIETASEDDRLKALDKKLDELLKE